MNTSTLNRQPQGIPIGGQFASTTKNEAEVSLGSTVDDLGLSTHEIQEIVSTAQALANRFAYRYNFSSQDAEDIAQETIHSVLKTRKRNPGARITGGLIHTAARAIASRSVDGAIRHEDSTALARLKAEIEQAEHQLERHLSSKEIDSMAARIRDNWHDPRHKPSVGFQNLTVVVSSDAMGLAFSDTQPTAVNYEPEGSSVAHELADQVESGEVSKTEARRRLWNTIHDDGNVPAAVPGSVSSSHARKHADLIKDALDTADRYIDGHASDEEVDALFAPFGQTSAAQRYAIADSIVSRPSVGHQLWRSALDFSNKRFTA